MTATLPESALQRTSLGRFAEALAAATPTPGGSCAAALPGALAAGLVAKVARLSAQSDPFGDLSYDLEAVASDADRLRAELLDLIDEGADAFERVMAARRLPAETPERRADRARSVQDAYKAVVGAPLRMCTRSLCVLELAREVAEWGNPNTGADARVAALLAAASVEAAALNVEIELIPVDDESFRGTCARGAESARRRAVSLRRAAVERTPTRAS